MFFARKDPDSVEDYSIDWRKWLGDESLSSAQWIAPPGIDIVDSSTTGSVATVRLSGGQAGQIYIVTCRATSSSGRVNDQSIRIICEEM